ncbi:hypothetical protein [Kutzneria sp. NPDC052558]|uniref:hypothetical protein n=1 Tax=Kutzneria sp. NPDC052558 TaxID=3364121 RepID=UPI0037C5BA44
MGADLDEFIAGLATFRGRPVSLIPFSTVVPEGPAPFSGLWVKAPTLDCIVYDDTAPQAVQRQAVFHEVAHMVLGHLSSEDLDDLQFRLMSALLPDLAPEVVRRTVRAGLCRLDCGGQTGYLDEQEQAAERFATALALRVADTQLIHPISPPDPADLAVIARFASTLRPSRRGRDQL